MLTPVYTEAQHDAAVALAQSLAPPTGNAVWIGLQMQDVTAGSWQWVWLEGRGKRLLATTNFSRWAAGEPDGRCCTDAWAASVVGQDVWWVDALGGGGGGHGRRRWGCVGVGEREVR